MLESNKKHTEVLFEETDILLGQHSQTFESHIPDQTPLNGVKKVYKTAESNDFSSPLSAEY